MLSATAQPALVNAPGLGFAWDARSSTVRAIRGIPGASVLGDGFDPGTPLTAAVISSHNDLALSVSSDGRVGMIRFGLPGSSQVIDGATPSPGRIVFGPSCAAALLIGSGVQLATGLDATPSVRDLSLPPFDSPIAAAAVADDGRTVLLSSGSGASAPVWLVVPEGNAIRLPLPGTIVEAAFRRQSMDAVAATRSGDVYVIRNAGLNPDIQQVYIGDDGTSDPVAVHFASDGSRAYLANTQGTVTSIDLRTGSAIAVSCQCRPSALEPLKAGNIFRLTEISDRPLMLFDASDSNPQIWFVPSDAPAASTQGSGQ